MSDALTEEGDQRRRSWITFESEYQFSDQLAELVPTAALRQLLLERGIQARIASALIAHRSDPDTRIGVHLDDGAGLLLTEAGVPGIPELMISFEYDPTWQSGAVLLVSARTVPELDDTEDASPS